MVVAIHSTSPWPRMFSAESSVLAQPRIGQAWWRLVFVKAVVHSSAWPPGRRRAHSSDVLTDFRTAWLMLSHNKKRWVRDVPSRQENRHPVMSGEYGEEKPGRAPQKKSCAIGHAIVRSAWFFYNPCAENTDPKHPGQT